MTNADYTAQASAKGETEVKNRAKYQGCLLGGAAGDALGYAVEFESEARIFSRYGSAGITDYALHGGKALISDDTQMTLFTANGLLLGEAAGLVSPSAPWPEHIGAAYKDWLRTQQGRKPGKKAWLNNVPELNSSRAPGTTCMAYLQPGKTGSLSNIRNDSCGCGGVMRVAPVGLYFDAQSEEERLAVDLIGAEAAAITHGHELGYMPAAMLTHMIQVLAHEPSATVEQALQDACKAMQQLFPRAEHLGELLNLIGKAETLARADIRDIEAIHQLGEGWVAQETLAIAVYCALRYENDFARALVAAVNHRGDSDSTGAVTGNILGARLGVQGIPEKFLNHLEARDVIVEIADDLYDGRENSRNWQEKYVQHTYKGGKKPLSAAEMPAALHTGPETPGT